MGRRTGYLVLFLLGVSVPAALAAAAWTPSQGRAALSASDSTLLSSMRAASGPGRLPLNRAVLIWVPAGVSIIGPADTRKLIEGLHLFNLDDDILATAIFEAADETWFAFFRYVDGGHVPDSGVLNPDSILTTIKIKNHDDNEERLSRGGRRLQIDGWQEAPRYDPTTHSLTWTVHATRIAKSTQCTTSRDACTV